MQLVNFAKSVFWGSEGEYKTPFVNADIKFKRGEKTSNTDKDFVAVFNRYVFENKFFQVATLGYMYLLAQGIGYEIAIRILLKKETRDSHSVKMGGSTGKPASTTTINVTTLDVENDVIDTLITLNKLPLWKTSICSVAGTISSITFSSFKLLLALALRSYITTPLSALLIIGSVIYISAEVIGSAISFASGQEEGLGYIRKNTGTLPAVIAGAVIVSQCALTIFLSAGLV